MATICWIWWGLLMFTVTPALRAPPSCHSWVFTLQSGSMSSVPEHLKPGPLHPVYLPKPWLCNSRCGLGPKHWIIAASGCTPRGSVLGCPALLQIHPFVVVLSVSVRADCLITQDTWGSWAPESCSKRIWTAGKELHLVPEYPALNIKLEP